MMEQGSVRLEMTVSEPWEFGTGPVSMDVLGMPSETSWLVSIRDGSLNPSDVGHADLQNRYAGDTLLPLLKGDQVTVSLGFRASGRPQGLIGTARRLF